MSETAYVICKSPEKIGDIFEEIRRNKTVRGCKLSLVYWDIH